MALSPTGGSPAQARQFLSLTLGSDGEAEGFKAMQSFK
jgi:hypothetical protein